MFFNGFQNQKQGLEESHHHDLSGVTSFEINHDHNYTGITSSTPNTLGHVHKFTLYTTTIDGHTHIVKGVTGRAIYLRNGEHYHLFNGVTSLDGSPFHTHQYSGQTDQY